MRVDSNSWGALRTGKLGAEWHEAWGGRNTWKWCSQEQGGTSQPLPRSWGEAWHTLSLRESGRSQPCPHLYPGFLAPRTDRWQNPASVQHTQVLTICYKSHGVLIIQVAWTQAMHWKMCLFKKRSYGVKIVVPSTSHLQRDWMCHVAPCICVSGGEGHTHMARGHRTLRKPPRRSNTTQEMQLSAQ